MTHQDELVVWWRPAACAHSKKFPVDHCSCPPFLFVACCLRNPMAFSLWPMWCLVCGHLVHAMRQVDKNYDVNPIDNMFCECKEVQSVEGCSNYGNTKFGLSSGIPRYYHEQVGKSEFEAKCIQMQGIVAWAATDKIFSLSRYQNWMDCFIRMAYGRQQIAILLLDHVHSLHQSVVMMSFCVHRCYNMLQCCPLRGNVALAEQKPWLVVLLMGWSILKHVEATNMENQTILGNEFLPTWPHVRAVQAQKKLCCRMSTNSKWRKMIKMWKKKYIRQDSKDPVDGDVQWLTLVIPHNSVSQGTQNMTGPSQMSLSFWGWLVDAQLVLSEHLVDACSWTTAYKRPCWGVFFWCGRL